MLRIGFDIDGVLSNFDTAYEALFVEVTGRNDFAPYAIQEGPLSWNWPTDFYGYTVEDTKEVWRRIKASNSFWFERPPMPEFDAFRKWFKDPVNRQHEIYFITARPGVNTKLQTENWFALHLDIVPTVLISDQKGMVCKALDINYYVDDKAENILDVGLKSPGTAAYLIDKAYNRHMNPGGTRIANLEEFLQVLNGITMPVLRTPMLIIPHD